MITVAPKEASFELKDAIIGFSGACKAHHHHHQRTADWPLGLAHTVQVFLFHLRQPTRGELN